MVKSIKFLVLTLCCVFFNLNSYANAAKAAKIAVGTGNYFRKGFKKCDKCYGKGKLYPYCRINYCNFPCYRHAWIKCGKCGGDGKYFEWNPWKR